MSMCLCLTITIDRERSTLLITVNRVYFAANVGKLSYLFIVLMGHTMVVNMQYNFLSLALIPKWLTSDIGLFIDSQRTVAIVSEPNPLRPLRDLQYGLGETVFGGCRHLEYMNIWGFNEPK